MNSIIQPATTTTKIFEPAPSWLKRYGQSFILIALGLLGLAVRLVRLDYPLIFDETYQYQSSAYSLGQIIPNLFPDHCPLFFFFSHFLLNLTNYTHDAVLLRLPAVFIGLLVIPASYLLGRELTGSYQTGLLAAFLCTFAAAPVLMSQYYRMYSLLMLLAVLTSYLLLRGLRYNQWWDWAAWILLNSLNLYNHYNAIFVLILQAAFGLVWLVFNLIPQFAALNRTGLVGKFGTYLQSQPLHRESGKPGWLWRRVLAMLVSFGLVGLLYLPWLPHLFNFTQATNYGINISLDKVDFRWQFVTFYLGQISFGDNPLSIGAGGVLAGLGLARLFYRQFYAGLFALIYIGFMLVIIFNLLSGYYFLDNPRYYSFVAPVYLILVAQGSLTAYGWGRQWLATFEPGRGLAMAGTGLLLASLLYASVHTLTKYPQTQTLFTPHVTVSQVQKLNAAATLLDIVPPTDRGSEDWFQFNLLFLASSNRANQVALSRNYWRLDNVTSNETFAKLKNRPTNTWLTIALFDGKTRDQIEAVAASDFVADCTEDYCVVGTHTGTGQDFRALLARFAFLNPPVIAKLLN